MSEFKFRAWNKEEKRMIEWEEFKSELYASDFESDKLEIMQWLGTEDDYEKEIYAGDILHVINGYGEHRIEFNVLIDVIYVDFMATIAVDLPVMDSENFEYNYKSKDVHDLILRNDIKIVGNIYKNPELLEESDLYI